MSPVLWSDADSVLDCCLEIHLPGVAAASWEFTSETLLANRHIHDCAVSTRRCERDVSRRLLRLLSRGEWSLPNKRGGDHR